MSANKNQEEKNIVLKEKIKSFSRKKADQKQLYQKKRFYNMLRYSSS